MSDSDGQSEPHANVPVADLLLTVSNEVQMLSDAAADLQTLIGDLVAAGAFGGSPSIFELQSLDSLCQNLGAVADFLKGISGNVSPEWSVDISRAVKSIKLADVSERLTGRKIETQATGEFEDFDNWPLTG